MCVCVCTLELQVNSRKNRSSLHGPTLPWADVYTEGGRKMHRETAALLCILGSKLAVQVLRTFSAAVDFTSFCLHVSFDVTNMLKKFYTRDFKGAK